MKHLWFTVWALVAALAAAPLPTPQATIPPASISAAQWTRVALPYMPLGIVAHGNDLWVCGANEMLAVSSDRGRTWALRHERPKSEILFTVNFVDANLAYALGSGGARLLTHDGGATWTEEDSPPNSAVAQSWFFNQNLGYANFKGALLQTADGGLHWTALSVKGAHNGDAFWSSLTVLDASHAIAWFENRRAKTPRVASTSDGGLHWTATDLPPKALQINIVAQAGAYHLYAMDLTDWQHPHRLHFTSADGGQWQAAAPPPVTFDRCGLQGCRVPNGWVDLAAAAPAYYALPPDADTLTHAWAVAQATFCQVGIALQCAQATAEAPPASSPPLPQPQQPVPIFSPIPAFPDRLKKAGREGFVVVLVWIDSDGLTSQVQLLEASAVGFAAAALPIVSSWTFHPAVIAGAAHGVEARIEVNFR